MTEIQKSFIETQFPVSKVSKESYKERKAGTGQALTNLGKWWGRKPLIMVRATVLGLLMPATDNPKRDHEIFLSILGMDDAGMLARKYKSIPPSVLYAKTTTAEKARYFAAGNNPTWKLGIDSDDKNTLQRLVFSRMSYDEKSVYCKRPDETENIPEESWVSINNYLDTSAQSLQELLEQLSIRRYGEVAKVGDCFAGGGSVPFESARIGLNTFGSDLNPAAALLTWASQNIGTDKAQISRLEKFQSTVYAEVDSQLEQWGIERNEIGDRANMYLYCNEVTCPACGWRVPLSPSWIVGMGSKTIAQLQPNFSSQSFDISIKMNASKEEIAQVNSTSTITSDGVNCLNCKTVTPISSIRRDRKSPEGKPTSGLRSWEKSDFYPRDDDIFQERLFAIRYERNVNGKSARYYTAPTAGDIQREKKVIELLSERFIDWQEKGYLPSDRIESGYNTDQPIRERGWSYWHQLFNPRQLLTLGLFIESSFRRAKQDELALATLGVNKIADWNSKLCRWGTGQARESAAQTFYNQALNTVYNYPVRALPMLEDLWGMKVKEYGIKTSASVKVEDARTVNDVCHFWITDPPYADAVNYHELSEFFLAWDNKLIKKTFPEWYSHSNRDRAVKGTGSSFAHSMVDVYKNLANHMPDDGMQVVMFTHQDPAVWAEMSLILWSAGLQVTAAWNIATETDASGLKAGNYVKGTVLMVLRKNLGNESGWLEDIYPQIKREVKLQIDSMRDLDAGAEPDFTDNDYMLAAYAASLKVLTSYKTLGDVNVELELNRERDKKNKSPIQTIIESAVRVAFEYLIPKGFSKATWKDFTKEEKYYIKALEFERTGNFALSSYQELARGLGVAEYTTMLASSKANAARVKTPVEFANKYISDSHPLAGTLVRQILMAIYVSIKNDDATAGKNWLRNEVPTYWTDRPKISEVFDAIIAFETVEGAEHWVDSVQYAKYVKSLVENDGV